VSTIRAALDEYCGFIHNPQKDGVWSLRIELTEKQASSLATFLNIEASMLRLRRSPYSSDERPPVLIPRLFAYLRGAIPQKERAELPSLTPKIQSQPWRSAFIPYRRGYSLFAELLTPPPRLGATKRRRLHKALEIYRRHFLSCMVVAVPESVTKVDVACRDPLIYFQVTEEIPHALRVSSPCEASLNAVKSILDLTTQTTLDSETTKIFSPESTLMQMYLPMLQLVPLSSVLKDKTARGNVRQALDEAQEDRFVHSIRATGIAAEELLVEIYETYLREKAPEAPLGNLMNDLSGRLQEIVHGVRASKESPLATARKMIGKTIETEKQGPKSQGVLALCEQIQKNMLPVLEALKQCIDDNPSLNIKAQKITLFPAHVQRCLSELLILRNRVSHRVERAVSVASVGYVDTAIALRDFIVVAKWWETERRKINYKGTRKAIIQETVKRSREAEQEPEGTA
jgi:hypothetical protein